MREVVRRDLSVADISVPSHVYARVGVEVTTALFARDQLIRVRVDPAPRADPRSV